MNNIEKLNQYSIYSKTPLINFVLIIPIYVFNYMVDMHWIYNLENMLNGL
jgi:hypothetical protein